MSSLDLNTSPTTFPIATPELIPVPVDFAERLALGEAVDSVVSVTLRHAASNATRADALSGSASINGTIVTQFVDGAKLSQRGQYQYVVTVNIGSRRESARAILLTVF